MALTLKEAKQKLADHERMMWEQEIANDFYYSTRQYQADSRKKDGLQRLVEDLEKRNEKI